MKNEIKLHLFFTDDYSYGSFLMGNGENLGSKLYYATLNLEYYTPAHVSISGNVADSNVPNNSIQEANIQVF